MPPTTDTTGAASAGSSTPIIPDTAPIQNEIERLKAELAAKEAEARRLEEEKAQAVLKTIDSTIAEFRSRLGVTSDDALIRLIRTRGVKSPKGKRLPETSLKMLYFALKNGATVPSVSKRFRLSEATINVRKKQWGLTHRDNVKLIPVEEAIKGFDESKVQLPKAKPGFWTKRKKAARN